MGGWRKIIHIDMDAFYASVEQRDNPAYRDKPIVVGGRPEQRGAVAAASYEARKFGIHSAMPARTAQQKCSDLIFVEPRFDVYREVSQQIRAIFLSYTDLVEPLALDEAYLDVTQNKAHIPSAVAIAKVIKQKILAATQLTASAGVSINKFLAKIASGMDKPDGLYLIAPAQAEAFVETLPIEKFHGIGQVTAKKMRALGIQTGADLKQWSEANLVQRFGKVGRFYYKVARGQDDRPVNPNRIRKSVGAEHSFAEDLTSLDQMGVELERLAQRVAERLDKQKQSGYTLTLKIKYADYQQITRSQTLSEPIRDASAIYGLAQDLLWAHVGDGKKVRLLGITISQLVNAAELQYIQLSLTL
ncbi:MAG: DNA polymerase IV [Leptolyngbyaceae cyanobacterium MO_188.B28]|nr:DNA polymerase IV [Leptolyngbyaceae cyanobacterium MO_188.B28]